MNSPSFGQHFYHPAQERSPPLNPWAKAFLPRVSHGGAHVANATQTSGVQRRRGRGRLYLLIHGVACEFCGEICLDPDDPLQRQEHIEECLQRAEEMKVLFAVARSRNKECGICLEVVMEKTGEEKKFGILPKCNHCFCLTCILKWRENQEVDPDVRFACPECRVLSGFICPSDFWIQNEDDKQELISEYLKSHSRYSQYCFY